MLIKIVQATSSINSPDDVITLVNKIGGFLYALIIVLGVLFVLIGAFHILTAGDKKDAFEKGKKQIFYAAAAVAIAVLATGIIKVIEDLAGKQ